MVNKVIQKSLIKILTAGKGYDDKKVRDELRRIGMRPLIKRREFRPINKAQNARMKRRDCGRRPLSETVNSMIKRKYTDTLYTKGFWNQVIEVLFMSVVHNIERKINKISVIYWRISIKLYF